MKITPKHPEFYLKYKNKNISSYGIRGPIVGYLITKEGTTYLLLEMNTLNTSGENIIDFAERRKMQLIDYHGDVNKGFFFICESDFLYNNTFVI